MANNSDKPAFTIISPTGSIVEKGLTKREYFAGLALQGLMANSWHSEYSTEQSELVELSVYMADQLLKELEKK